MQLVEPTRIGPAAHGSRSRHFAVITSPVPGHLNPLQVLAAELIALGHRVSVVHVAGAARFVTEPGVHFAPLRHRDGAEPLDGYLAKLARPHPPLGLTRMIRATAGMTETLLDGAPAAVERIGADAIIADMVEPAGPLIARRMGLPHVTAVTGLPLMREADVPPPFVGWRYQPDAAGRSRNRGGYQVADRLTRPITDVTNRWRDRWGLQQEADDAHLYVAQCPRGLDFPRNSLPPGFRYGAPWRRALDVDVDMPDDGRPLVFCSLGTLQGSRRRLFAVMAQACAAIGARAVIGHGGGLSPIDEASLPGNPLVRAFWPQEAVLRRCSAAVLHGGFNSVLDALAAGVPIVALPIAFEQPATAARVARIGAGRVLSLRWLGMRALARTLDEVIRQPGYRIAARRIAAEVQATGGAAAAAAAITAALAPCP